MSGTATTTAAAPGLRKNGKQWHTPKKAFRPVSGQTSYAKRAARTTQIKEIKETEKEMKAAKEEERQVCGPREVAGHSIYILTWTAAASHSSDQRPPRCQGREGTV
jgi:rRNA-processing protein CGR1